MYSAAYVVCDVSLPAHLSLRPSAIFVYNVLYRNECGHVLKLFSPSCSQHAIVVFFSYRMMKGCLVYVCIAWNYDVYLLIWCGVTK